MADSACGQDKTNPVFLLATRAGTMIARDIRVGPVRKSYLFGHIRNRLLTKRNRSRWLDIGLTLFCAFIDLDNAKKNSWPISSHVVRILLVNNAYRNTDGFHGFLVGGGRGGGGEGGLQRNCVAWLRSFLPNLHEF